MTEFRVQVVRLGKVGKHPNADSLSITSVSGNYPVIFRTGDFESGGLAVHVPPDALVPTVRDEFSWLASKADANGLHRVRYAKLLGIPSFGFLVPVPRTPNSDEALSEGQDVRHLLGVSKYEPGPVHTMEGSENALCPLADMVPHYDIEGLRKHESLFCPNEEVWVTEKIHGSNGRCIS